MLASKGVSLEKCIAPTVSIGKGQHSDIEVRTSELFLARLLNSSPKLSTITFELISDEGLRLIAASSGPSLRVIEATLCIDSDEEMMSMCRKCPNLTEFKIDAGDCVVFGDKIIESVAQFCPLIEIISMKHWALTNAAVHALASIHTLREFQIDRPHQLSSIAVQHALQANPLISNICLDGPFIDAALVKCIGKFCRNLTTLELTKDVVFDNQSLHTLFHGCSLLTSLKLKPRGTLSNASLTLLFQNRRLLVELDLSMFKHPLFIPSPPC